MPAKTSPDRETLRTTLDELRTEMETIAARIEAAQRTGDATTWMSLMSRERDLPDLVVQARRDVAPRELAHAWDLAENLHAKEQEAATTHADLYSALQLLSKNAPLVTADLGAKGEYAIKFDVLAKQESTARRAHEAARDATCRALHEVERWEAELHELDVEDSTVRDGLRAFPHPATGNVMYTEGQLMGGLDDILDDLDSRLKGNRSFSGTRTWLLTQGAVPPRWLAHLHGHAHFSDGEAVRQREEEDLQRQAARREELLNAQVGRPTGLGSGGKPSWRPRGLGNESTWDRAFKRKNETTSTIHDDLEVYPG